MCTGINLIDKNENVLFARTMDFSFELDPVMGIVPRNYELNFTYGSSLKKHYAFQGLTKNLGTYVWADGINEHGFIGATLYFEGYAKYNDSVKEGNAINLAPFEFVNWALACYTSVEALLEDISRINIINTKIDFLGGVPPLHYVFTDITGRSIVVEPVDGVLRVHENVAGVLTNAPDYSWHITNLRNYIGIKSKQEQPLEYNDKVLRPFGQGSGTFGLPGDFTPPSRFVRTAYTKSQTEYEAGEAHQVVAAAHILHGVDIPKGAVATQRNTLDYTQYISFMAARSQKYYFRVYHACAIVEVDMYDYDLEGTDIIIIEIPKDVTFASV